MYLGFYTSKVTAKNQMTFPKHFQKMTGKKLLITNWFENSIIILPLDKAEKLLNKAIENVSSLLPEARDLARFFYGSAQTITLDKKNRFVIPKRLKEFAKIKKEVVFIGVADRIEIWDKKIYENYGKIREVQIRETAVMHYSRLIKQREDKI